MVPSFFVLYSITNEKTKIDANRKDPCRLPRFLDEIGSSNSGRYALLKSHIPWLETPVQQGYAMAAVEEEKHAIATLEDEKHARCY